MDIREEWRTYDPNDIRTHPENSSDTSVEIVAEFDNGNTIRGRYFRDGGWFSRLDPGSPILDAKLIRWHYTEPSPEDQ